MAQNPQPEGNPSPTVQPPHLFRTDFPVCSSSHLPHIKERVSLLGITAVSSFNVHNRIHGSIINIQNTSVIHRDISKLPMHGPICTDTQTYEHTPKSPRNEMISLKVPNSKPYLLEVELAIRLHTLTLGDTNCQGIFSFKANTHLRVGWVSIFFPPVRGKGQLQESPLRGPTSVLSRCLVVPLTRVLVSQPQT